MMKILWMQHVPFEGLGCIADWIEKKGHSVDLVRPFAGDPFPHPVSFDWLIVMGGPMSVNDRHIAWLQAEKEFLQKCIYGGKTVIGICLGAQLIAAALGSAVYPNVCKEIGWYPVKFYRPGFNGLVTKVFPEDLTVFHWHGDTFDPPPNSVLFAGSAACRHQAFFWGERVYGFQFHLEMTLQGAAHLIANCGDDMSGGDYIQTAAQILADDTRFDSLNRVMEAFLDALAEVSYTP